MTRFRPFLVPLAALLLAACGGGSKGSNDGSEVLATVGDRNITAAEFADAFHRTGRADVDTADTPEGRRAFLQDLINRELMELGAYEAYPEAPIQLQWRLKRLRDGRLKDEIRNSLVTRSFQITPAMKDQLYENLSRERHLLGMLILDDAEAQYVREQLDAGAEWGPLALDHSAQWSTPQEAGDLGWQSAGSLPWELDQEVWSVPVGTTVGPRKYPLGNYIIRVVEERPAKAPGTRQNLEALLDERLREPLHLNAQKAMLDSLEAVEQPYYPSDGMQLLQLKYYWEAQTENPLEYLDANRVRPTFTAEEETTIVVEFKEAPDWTAGEFADRLDWYAQGLWLRGKSMKQLRESMGLVVGE